MIDVSFGKETPGGRAKFRPLRPERLFEAQEQQDVHRQGDGAEQHHPDRAVGYATAPIATHAPPPSFGAGSRRSGKSARAAHAERDFALPGALPGRVSRETPLRFQRFKTLHSGRKSLQTRRKGRHFGGKTRQFQSKSLQNAGAASERVPPSPVQLPKFDGTRTSFP